MEIKCNSAVALIVNHSEIHQLSTLAIFYLLFFFLLLKNILFRGSVCDIYVWSNHLNHLLKLLLFRRYV